MYNFYPRLNHKLFAYRPDYSFNLVSKSSRSKVLGVESIGLSLVPSAKKAYCFKKFNHRFPGNFQFIANAVKSMGLSATMHIRIGEHAFSRLSGTVINVGQNTQIQEE